jgi:hypothetical protein
VDLPNADRAVVDLRKLRDYCLNMDHPRGRHKARLFRAILGLTAEDADRLRGLILQGARNCVATRTEADEHGVRYLADLELSVENRTARVRTAWIVRKDEDFPRLLTCYVL